MKKISIDYLESVYPEASNKLYCAFEDLKQYHLPFLVRLSILKQLEHTMTAMYEACEEEEAKEILEHSAEQ